MNQALLDAVFQHWASLPNPSPVPANSQPLPYFGSQARFGSRMDGPRVVTVGVNPGPNAFPAANPWLYHGGPPPPIAAGAVAPLWAQYQPWMERPLDAWFNCWVRLLDLFGQSRKHPLDYGVVDAVHGPGYRYVGGILHLDLMSPLTTVPNWAGLGTHQRLLLSGFGILLFFHQLQILHPSHVCLCMSQEQMRTAVFAASAAGWSFEFAVPHRNQPCVYGPFSGNNPEPTRIILVVQAVSPEDEPQEWWFSRNPPRANNPVSAIRPQQNAAQILASFQAGPRLATVAEIENIFGVHP